MRALLLVQLFLFAFYGMLRAEPFEFRTLQDKDEPDERIRPITNDSAAWIRLLHTDRDSIVVEVNGMLMTDGACTASLLLNIQKKENGEWKDCCGSHWSQMDCGLSFIFYRIERFTFIPGNTNGLNTPGEYRFAVRTYDLGYLYSKSFRYKIR